MEGSQVNQDLQILKQKSIALSENLEQLWLEFYQQQETLKLIQSQNQYFVLKESNKFKKVIKFVIPYLQVQQVFEMRLLNKEYLKIISQQKHIINVMIDHQIQNNQEKLYEFNIIDKNSRELFKNIVMLNFYAKKIKESRLPNELQSVLQEISDPTQIQAYQIAKKIQNKISQKNTKQKQFIDDYCDIAYQLSFQSNTNIAAEFKIYRKEILRQKNLKKLHTLRPFVNNL
ncbi:unnamed protein product [Paramecium sonneborni]|uniref:Uncharacterized protein n=1 Tax=Paramecium sonneborni TaxID=65129 RepID=A0A8S1M1F4_9CILI|nr:unnamed protein product [Paramecium sonneborni]